MTGPYQLPAPRRDPWTVAVHAAPPGPRGRGADRPLGSGIVIDRTRVLTAYSVVRERHTAGSPLWVAFPKAAVPRSERRRVAAVRAEEDGDVAVLVLAEPVPDAVLPAPLLCPDGADLVGEHWWAFGFPAATPFGDDAYGVIAASLGYGWVRLASDEQRMAGEGFAGAGLWSPRYAAVVGVVGRTPTIGRYSGEASALTLCQAARDLPGERLHALAGWSVADAGEAALAAWGWSLQTDAEAPRHWRPRARGGARGPEGRSRVGRRRAARGAGP
ncbi:serine protease, partial [Actinoplanes sp. NPDC024001]|uniref:S1 family peptidase n=1 Tax=Actinoplanes sp. NPDC024001 TaxID=3154598 RepID=UPI0033CD21E1